MIIQHNIMALNSNNRLAGNNTQVAKNLEKLSSGYKINRAGDDAAGLAISEKMRAQITGLTRASQNAQDGVSLVQTAEGQLTEVHSMLNRMVDLATQSSNGTYEGNVDRKNLQKEVQALKDEIDRIATTSNFNGIKLLDGSLSSGAVAGLKTASTIAIAPGTKNTITGAVDITVTGLDAGKTFKAVLTDDGGTTANGIVVDANGNVTLNLKGTAGKSYTQADIDNLIKNATLPESAKNLKIEISGPITVGTVAADADTDILGATAVAAPKTAFNTNAANGVTVTAGKGGSSMNGKTLTFSLGAQGVTIDTNGNISVGLATGKDYSASDINQMLTKAGADMSVSFEGTRKGSAAAANAGTFGNVAYTLGGGAGVQQGGGLNLQIGDTADQRVMVSVGNMGTASLGLSAVDVSTEAAASASMQIIKDAINSVSGTRADLGAVQNRLEHTINNLTTTTENMTAAESRIRDTNMAQEMMAFTKNNVLAQAAQAMLAQANQQPQQVLQLLR